MRVMQQIAKHDIALIWTGANWSFLESHNGGGTSWCVHCIAHWRRRTNANAWLRWTECLRQADFLILFEEKPPTWNLRMWCPDLERGGFVRGG